MKKYYSEDVVKALKVYIFNEFNNNACELAAHYGTSNAYISKMIHRKASFPDWLLKDLGFEKHKTIYYTKVKK